MRHHNEYANKERESERDTARENQRISTRIDLEVLNSFDLIITTSTRDNECVLVSAPTKRENQREQSEREKGGSAERGHCYIVHLTASGHC